MKPMTATIILCLLPTLAFARWEPQQQQKAPLVVQSPTIYDSPKSNTTEYMTHQGITRGKLNGENVEVIQNRGRTTGRIGDKNVNCITHQGITRCD